MKRILVTGSRDFREKEVLREALILYGPGLVIEGRAKGADLLARQVASELGWPKGESHPADWTRHGLKAGNLRNQEMVDLGADVCLAFPLRGSRGTWDCAARALRARIALEVFLTDGLTEIEMDAELNKYIARLERE